MYLVSFERETCNGVHLISIVSNSAILSLLFEKKKLSLMRQRKAYNHHSLKPPSEKTSQRAYNIIASYFWPTFYRHCDHDIAYDMRRFIRHKQSYLETIVIIGCFSSTLIPCTIYKTFLLKHCLSNHIVDTLIEKDFMVISSNYN